MTMPKKSWQDSYTEYLLENAGMLTVRQIADNLGVLPCQVRTQAKKLKLKLRVPFYYKPEEILYAVTQKR